MAKSGLRRMMRSEPGVDLGPILNLVELATQGRNHEEATEMVHELAAAMKERLLRWQDGPALRGREAPSRGRGSFADPIVKSDSTECRQTSLVLPLALSEQLADYFEKNRGRFKTRNAVVVAAIERYLATHE